MDFLSMVEGGVGGQFLKPVRDPSKYWCKTHLQRALIRDIYFIKPKTTTKALEHPPSKSPNEGINFKTTGFLNLEWIVPTVMWFDKHRDLKDLNLTQTPENIFEGKKKCFMIILSW